MKHRAFPLLNLPSLRLYFYIMKNNNQPLKKNTTMKTTKFFSTLSIFMIFALATLATTTSNDKRTDMISASSIRYHVNVMVTVDKPLCNIYLIKILDGNGTMVAPAKAYTPGVTGYDFYEHGPATGTRIAVLVKYQYGDHFECPNELFTPPVFLSGLFKNAQTYRFDLYPTFTSPKP